MLCSPRLIPFFIALGAALFPAPSLQAAPAFSVPGFVDEEIYKGNGMISMQFDFKGRLWVTEKNGRILILEPNEAQVSPFSFQYFEKEAGVPDWKNLPDFSKLKPVQSGTVSSFTLQPKLRNDNYAFRFTGTIPVTQSGSYTFYLASDDGSRLYVDDKLVVDYDGLHPDNEKSASVNLTQGDHSIRVEYFNQGGGQSLKVLYEGPGKAKGPVASSFFKEPLVFADFSKEVNTEGERGLLGIALDPDFAKNHFLYVLFSTNTDQRVLRLTANADFTALVPGSETILLSGLPNLNPVHKAGDIAFHPKDPQNLFIVTGDDGDRDKVANLDNYSGKILRIRASDGKGLSSNPFFDGKDDSVRSKIWSYGYRNPFRFIFDPATPIADVLYISENGDGTDRLLRVEKGAEGGWPREFNDSSKDGKRIVLQTSDPSKTAIAIVRDGPLGKDGPILYNARYGGGDRSEVRRWKLSGAKLDQLVEISEDQGKAFFKGYTDYNIVSFTEGPDGALYYTDSNQGDSLGKNYRLGRLRFVKGGTPSANFAASATSGPAPLEISFKDSSTSPDGPVTFWEWDFGDGNSSTQEDPKHRYAQPGLYTASLKVANASGLNDRKQVSIQIFQKTTLSLKGQIHDARNLDATPLSVPVELRVYQIDGSTPLPFTGGTGPDQNILKIPAGGKIDAKLPLQITETGLTISAGEGDTNGLQSAWVGIPLTYSPEQTATLDYFLSDSLIRGRVLDTKHQPAPVDLGLAKDGAKVAFASGRASLTVSFKTANEAAKKSGDHIVPDRLGYYHIPLPKGSGEGGYVITTSTDTLSETHGKVRQSLTVTPGKTTIQNFTIGLYDGGTGEADLSAFPVTAHVDFEKQIQPIFTSSCVACHNGIATNTGGLDLQAGKSLKSLLRESSQAPGIQLVDPGSPARSYLMEKIDAQHPQVGTSMRPGDPMNLAQRALIRDWISQLPPTP